MKQLKTVFKFEYLGQIRSKSYIVMTVILLVVMAVGGSVPAISGLFKSIFGDGGSKEPAELKKAAIYDASGLYTGDVLSAFLPEYEWIALDTADGVAERIEGGEFESALAIDGLNYTVYEKQESIAAVAAEAEVIEAMVRSVYQSEALAAEGMSPDRIASVLGASPVGEYVTVGKDYFQNYALAYALVILLYMSIMLYGQMVLTSVVTEKSSKAMELLVTSARPMSLMFGKVFGTGFAGLTQFGAYMLCAAAALGLNLRGWEMMSPVMAGIINSAFAAGILVYAVVFFLFGFFSFAFIYAGLGSTVSRMEDAGNVTVIPMILILAAYLLGISSIMTPYAIYVRICSYVPFLSPMIMFVRICMTDVPPYEIAAVIALNCAYVFGLGYISAKIYRVGVMMYGKAPKLRDIARYVRQA
ncbi:MAG: ABC transporter permease [Oscillospiraceae bacterium]|jgi:ABC-2 type transport system permease protein|nr:ABC transporter permease [Oscillospiraceae bacterium]